MINKFISLGGKELIAPEPRTPVIYTNSTKQRKEVDDTHCAPRSIIPRFNGKKPKTKR